MGLARSLASENSVSVMDNSGRLAAGSMGTPIASLTIPLLKREIVAVSRRPLDRIWMAAMRTALAAWPKITQTRRNDAIFTRHKLELVSAGLVSPG
jgi:predicted homoserine dehydrogenase-like protein